MATTSSSDFYIAKLSWLPVTSLLRFKSVCKSWFSIISSPAFIETHLINTKKKQPSSLIRISESDLFVCHDAVCIYTSPSAFYGHVIRINIPRDVIGMTQCFHSCNGLLFHHNMMKFSTSPDYVSFMWNPLTKWLKIVPITEEHAKETRRYRLGFGFDFISGDYKIFRIVLSLESLFDSLVEAELYSVSGDSWKKIQAPDAIRSLRPTWSDPDPYFVHANGVLYFVGYEEPLAFDLHSEVFKVFPDPNPLHYTRRSLFLDYEGSVAMIFKELDGDGSICSLWTLDDVSWTKKFNLEVNTQYWVYFYLGVGQFVASDYNGQYVIYDHRKNR